MEKLFLKKTGTHYRDTWVQKQNRSRKAVCLLNSDLGKYTKNINTTRERVNFTVLTKNDKYKKMTL